MLVLPPAHQQISTTAAWGLPREKAEPHCSQAGLLWAAVLPWAEAGSRCYSLCALVLVLLDDSAQKKGTSGSSEEFQSFKELVKRIQPLGSLNNSCHWRLYMISVILGRYMPFFNENILSPPVKNKFRQRKQDNIELEGRILQNIRADSSFPFLSLPPHPTLGTMPRIH